MCRNCTEVFLLRKIRPKKLNNMFLRHFFSEKDAGGRLFIFIFLPFLNKNDVPTMFRKNFRLLISGAESQERVHQNTTNQPTIFASKQGKMAARLNDNS